ncbi:acyltransferase family protein [Tsukamurella sp. USMM236]|uniref:acyltransferase family protein n=1 Tax=Tsukamurella sp. USMM236 TaxID=3081301 RepID=UPI0030179B29
MATTSIEPAHTNTQHRQRRLDSLTALRFPAALAVMLFHSALPELNPFHNHTAADRYYGLLCQAGGLGVTFFFILSGFVLTWSYRPSQPRWEFWARRYAKIIPLYILAGLIAVVTLVAVASPPTRQDIIDYFTMTQVWHPEYLRNFALLPPGWSLSVEALFYLTFPLLWSRIAAFSVRSAWAAAAASMATIVAVCVIGSVLPTTGGVVSNEPNHHGLELWFTYVFPVGRMPEFVLGCCLAVLVKRDALPRISMATAALSMVAGYLIASIIPVTYGWRIPLVIPCLLMIAATARLDLEGAPSPLRRRPLQRLGEWSFAFYLLHYSVLRLLHHAFGARLNNIAADVLYLTLAAIASIVVSALLFKYFEEVTMRWARSGIIKLRGTG